MTRHEIMLAAAKKRMDKATAAYHATEKRARDALDKVTTTHAPRRRQALVVMRGARADVTRRELLSHGITPMHTIVRMYGVYYAVWVKVDGFAEMVPVTARNSENRRKNNEYPPRDWSKVTITDRVLVVGD